MGTENLPNVDDLIEGVRRANQRLFERLSNIPSDELTRDQLYFVRSYNHYERGCRLKKRRKSLGGRG